MRETTYFSEDDRKGCLSWLLLSLLVLILDQLTKTYILGTFELYETRAVFQGLNVTLAYNTGAAFSFLSEGGGWQRWFFITVGIGVVIWLTLWLARLPARSKWMALSLSLIIGGAVGNLWDRVLLGYVVDFVQLYWRNWYWPAFNVADAAITIGAIIMAFEMFSTPEQRY